MAAQALGLLIASAQKTYPTQNAKVQQLGAVIARLDRFLKLYSQRADGSRQLLRQAVVAVHDGIWAGRGAQLQN